MARLAIVGNRKVLDFVASLAVVRVAVTQSELFSKWPLEALAHLVESADVVELEPGCQLLWSGDTAAYLYLVASGSLLLTRMSAVSRPFTMGRHVAGDFLGLGPVLTQANYIHDVICRERAVLVRVPGVALRELIERDGRLSCSLFAALEGRHLRARDLYVNASVASTRARIAELLRSMSLRGSAGRFSADIYLSQDEIGAMLGTRRQVVNRVLREMADIGVLNVQYGRISILDLDTLSLMATDSFHDDRGTCPRLTPKTAMA